MWSCNLTLQYQWEPRGTYVTDYTPLWTANCILVKPHSLLKIFPSHFKSYKSAGRTDSATFFLSFATPRLISCFHPSSAETDVVCPFTTHHHHHHNQVKTWSSGFFAVCMYRVYVVLSSSVIRYNVFIKCSSVPAPSSQCFFVPARPVNWVTHIIAAQFSHQWLGNTWLTGNEPHHIHQIPAYNSVSLNYSHFSFFISFENIINPFSVSLFCAEKLQAREVWLCFQIIKQSALIIF